MHHSDQGYYVTFVHFGGRKEPKTVRVMIHKIVAECWLGDKPEGYEIDHIDRNTHNNDYRNLRYVSKTKENTQRERMKPVELIHKDTGEKLSFESFAASARFLSQKYNKSFDAMRDRFKRNRSFIYDYHIVYTLRNAETGHDDSTE